MSQATNQGEKSPSPQSPLEQTSNEPLKGVTGVSGPVGVAGVPAVDPIDLEFYKKEQQVKIDAAVKEALANQDAKISEAVTNALNAQQAARMTEEARIAEAVAEAVAKAVAAIPTVAAQAAPDSVNPRQKTTAIEEREDGTPIAEGEMIFLVKDKDRKYPITKNALSGVICYQTRKGEYMGTTVEVPANDLSAIGIYTEDQYAQFSKPGGLFASQRINVEVWHKPGDKNSVQK